MLHQYRTLIASFLVAGLVLFTGCTQEALFPQEESSTSPELSSATTHQASADEAETTGQHLVLFKSERIPNNFRRELSDAGGTLVKTLDAIGIAVVDGLSDEEAAALEENESIQQVEPDLLIPLETGDFDMADEDVAEAEAQSLEDNTSTYFYPRQWHLRTIGLEKVWEAGHFGSEDVTVSIIDSGLDYNHANLRGLVDLDRSISLLPGQDNYVEQYFPGAHPIADLNRHGTHVGATVASNPEIHAGVTQNTTLFGVKVCRGRGGGTGSGCPRSAVLEAITYSADQGADIMNISIGGTSRLRYYNGLHRYILRATNYAHRKGALVVVSAGNSAANMDRERDLFRVYCDAPNVVCVSATGPTARDSREGPFYNINEPAFFTNYGRSTVDVAAPGGNTNNFVYAACSSFSLRNTNCQNSGRYIIGLRGTSMAAPHVSGLAALIMADIGTGNPARVRNILHQTADQLGDSGNDPYYGKGLINAAQALGVE